MATKKIAKKKPAQAPGDGWKNCQLSEFDRDEARVYIAASSAAMAIAREAFAHVELEMVERLEAAELRLKSLAEFRAEKA